MSIHKKKGLTLVTVVYWLLLLYIIVALVWWFIALQYQNMQMSNYKLLDLKQEDPHYLSKAAEISRQEKRKTTQYISEGITFLLLILVGAVFVYRSVRKQLKLNRQQQNFMMAVTHELKTPIAVAKLNLETLQKHKLDETKQQKLIQSTLEEAERLNALANNILISSQLEGGNYKLSKEELNFSLLTDAIIKDYQKRFPDRKIVAALQPEIEINGDALLLEILISNLADNALKYSPKESPVFFSLSQNNNTVLLEVKDEGPGIPDSEKKKVFERFYRIGNEQVRKAKGTGLGLYLCKKIATDHRADIVVTNNNPTGSIFTVHFNI
jgi:two-component system, OmpR family, sensor histidine kinase CiaH